MKSNIRDNQEIFNKVESNINQLVDNEIGWTHGATSEMIQEARNGILNLQLGVPTPISKEWLGDSIDGKKVLCLAGAGGLQGPILAAAGASVTVLDISEKMLDNDRKIAEKENLDIEIIHGNMCDLSCFAQETFDIIINPVSLIYVPDIIPVFRECYRVLKRKGSLIMAAPNPVNYLCNYIQDDDGGYYKAENRMPYRSSDFEDQGDWLEYGHTMESYIGGQIECGFIISGYIEHQKEDITELFFVTKADKI